MSAVSKTTNRAVSPLDALFQEVENWFGSAGRGTSGLEFEGYGYPVVNVAGNEEQLELLAEIPGVDPEKLDVQVEGRLLTLSGERPSPELPEGASWVRRERSSGAFKRSYRLPYEVESAKVTARYVNGVLHVVLPRHEASKPQKININLK